MYVHLFPQTPSILKQPVHSDQCPHRTTLRAHREIAPNARFGQGHCRISYRPQLHRPMLPIPLPQKVCGRGYLVQR